MRKPRLTKNISEGLAVVISLAGEDMMADQKRDWGHAKAALDYLNGLRTWHNSKKQKQIK